MERVDPAGAPAAAAPRDRVGLLLAAALAALLAGYLPTLVETQIPLWVSDHGWDLYAIQQTARGAVPCRDFLWPYGPLPLYYYAAFFRVLGESVLAARIGYLALLLLTTGLAVRFTWRRAGPIAALAAGVLLFAWGQPPALFTQGVLLPCAVLAVEFALRLSECGRCGDRAGARRALLGLVAVQTVAFLSKPTMAIASSGGIAAGLALADLLARRARREAAWPPRLLPLAAAAVAPVLLGGLLLLPWIHELPLYRLRMTFPWAPGQYPGRVNPFLRLLEWFYQLSVVREANGIGWWLLGDRLFLLSWAWAGVLALSAGVVARAALRREDPGPLAVVLPIVAATGTELVTLGSVYSLITGGLVPLAIAFALLAGRWPARRRTAAAAVVFALACAWIGLMHASIRDQDAVELDLPRGQVVVGPRQLSEVERAVTEFLEHNLAPGDALLVLPYGPLYNFLSGRPCPLYSPQHILPYRAREEDPEYARVLAARPVPCVLIVNTWSSLRFGADYGQLLAAEVGRRYQKLEVIASTVPRTHWGDEAHSPEVIVYWRKDLPPPTWWPR